MRKGKIRDWEQYEGIARLYLKGFGWEFALTSILGDYNQYKLQKLLRNREFMGIMMKELRPIFDEMKDKMDEEWALRLFKKNMEGADPKNFMPMFESFMQALGHMDKDRNYLPATGNGRQLPRPLKQISEGLTTNPAEREAEDTDFEDVDGLPDETREFIATRKRAKAELGNVT